MSIVKKVVVATMAAVAVAGAAVVGAKHPEPINKFYDGKITGMKNLGKGAVNKVLKAFNRNSQESGTEMESTTSEPID